ncbi:MAG TPA: DUF5996 family protein [Caulobacteraceae bacterium]|jgi:hypothetical protein
MSASTADLTPWPKLFHESLKATAETLQLWTQVVGKLRLAQTPWLNHSWHVPLYVTARGFSTSLIPHAAGAFDIEFDFVASVLVLRTVSGHEATTPLEPQSVASFYARVMAKLEAAGIPVVIDTTPSEIADPIPFPDDRAPRAYDAVVARDLWRALVKIDQVFKLFRTGFLGKASPVHLFWGGLDLAVTRFSGRPAPAHPGGVPHLPDAVVREAYSHEVSSAGFWPGGGGVDHPAFYSYAYPEPPGFRDTAVKPDGAAYNASLGEFVLPYEAVRAAPDPQAALLAFLSSTYAAAAEAGGWDRAALECDLGKPGVPRPT